MNAYGIKIMTIKQPMIKVESDRGRVYMDKDTKQFKQSKNYIYLVPQLVSSVGLTNAQKRDREIMRELTPVVKLSPKQHILNNANLI